MLLHTLSMRALVAASSDMARRGPERPCCSTRPARISRNCTWLRQRPRNKRRMLPSDATSNDGHCSAFHVVFGRAACRGTMVWIEEICCAERMVLLGDRLQPGDGGVDVAGGATACAEGAEAWQLSDAPPKRFRQRVAEARDVDAGQGWR